jgi:hypothetical protein
MKDTSWTVALVGLLVAIVFGAVVGAFVAGTVLSFYDFPNGTLIGAGVGALLVALVGLLYLPRGGGGKR